MCCTISVDQLIRKRSAMLIFAVSLVIAGIGAGSARGTTIQMASGLSSAGVPVSFEADLTISGNTLTVDLVNTSTVHSQNPNDVLGSYYFDIVNGANIRPTLTYASAIGNVWLANKSAPDTLQTTNANLKAVAAGDNTWQFRNMNATLNPFLGFGVGTVGNSNLTPNNFMGNIVDGLDYSIYAGDTTTNNLKGKLLVKDRVTFTFTGVAGFTEADIRPTSAFGMSTAPDSLLKTQEPATIALVLGGGIFGLFGLRRRVR